MTFHPAFAAPSGWRALAAAACIGLPCLPGPALAAEKLRIELSAQAQVKNAEVLLGDIARLDGPALPRQVQLGSVLLGRMPQTGAPMVLEREALSRWVRQQTGLKEEQIRWTGAQSVEVSWLKRTLPGQKVTQLARDGLLQWLAGRSERAQVECLTEVADLQLAAGDFQLRLRPFTEAVPRPRMLAWVDVFAGERFLRAIPVGFKVDAWKTVAVAPPQGLPSGGQLAADTALPTREVNLAQLPPRDAAGGAASLALGEPVRLRRAVEPGGPLTPSHFEPLPAVARGDWAVLQTGSGAVVLESRVQVAQDARVGQAIRVKPAHSPSFVWARVKGPHLLELVQ